jgi:hypothetical protein
MLSLSEQRPTHSSGRWKTTRSYPASLSIPYPQDPIFTRHDQSCLSWTKIDAARSDGMAKGLDHMGIEPMTFHNHIPAMGQCEANIIPLDQ